MAALLGLEPKQADPESAVLPLHHRAKKLKMRKEGFGALHGTRLCSSPFRVGHSPHSPLLAVAAHKHAALFKSLLQYIRKYAEGGI